MTRIMRAESYVILKLLMIEDACTIANPTHHV